MGEWVKQNQVKTHRTDETELFNRTKQVPKLCIILLGYYIKSYIIHIVLLQWDHVRSFHVMLSKLQSVTEII